ncbi:hypothetical protein FOZ61_006624 [Perkinsus olseni]|uniref:Uncharacterized protein n=1 Tax=Perkinsus olseni TaxID=32597 RepID=A0A7J6LN85_PEROL|nr:hypothetical protein FOZ61_006624 [Perkinsus olseni]KAF4660371.1 hypothetical protein FOL46_006168 [Perkinsus olseni]
MIITKSSFVPALVLLTLASAQQAGLYTYINEQTSYIRTLIKEDKTMYLFYNCIGMETAPRLGPFPLRPGSAPGENTVDYESSGGVEKVHAALMENCPDFGLVDGDLLTIAERPEQSEPEYNKFKDRMQEVCGIALSPNDFKYMISTPVPGTKCLECRPLKV